jgi:DNA mismatch endonuclease (patch repair protein)
MSGFSIRSRAPAASSPTVQRVMLANRSSNTTPERLLRSALFNAGVRFRRNVRPVANLKCEADIVLRKRRLCIFVDGCFWHGCPKHFGCPKTNSSWWNEKIEATKARDCNQSALLKAAGWNVLRIWEHEIAPTRVSSVVSRIKMKIASLKPT